MEAPSQMLEHWCWQPEMLRGFSRHFESGDPLPTPLIDRMIEAKHVSSAIATLRQVYFSRLDLAYHTQSGQSSDAIARELHSITGFPFPEDTHFQAGFGHLFGYDAGYYGYLWSRVFGDDMFTRFEAPGRVSRGGGGGVSAGDSGAGRDGGRRSVDPQVLGSGAECGGVLAGVGVGRLARSRSRYTACGTGTRLFRRGE